MERATELVDEFYKRYLYKPGPARYKPGSRKAQAHAAAQDVALAKALVQKRPRGRLKKA